LAGKGLENGFMPALLPHFSAIASFSISAIQPAKP
jgi:hypothetical protein